MVRYAFFILLIFAALAGCSGKRSPGAMQDPAIEISRCQDLARRKVYDEAIECFEVFKSRHPMGSLASQATLSIADTYFKQKEFGLAAETYLEFLREVPYHPQTDYAYYRTGLSYFKQVSRAIDRDQANLDEAILYLSKVPEFFPDSSYKIQAEKDLREARQRRAEREFYVARFYFRAGEFLAAVPRLGDLVQRYPDQPQIIKPSFDLLFRACMKSGQLTQAGLVIDLYAKQFGETKKLTGWRQEHKKALEI